MKRLLTIVMVTVITLLTLSSCTNSVQSHQLEGIQNEDLIIGTNTFAFDIFKELNKEDSESNIFISPFSIASALAMTSNGASGTTLDEMKDTLYVTNLLSEDINNGYLYTNNYLNDFDDKHTTINVANSIWVKNDYHINQDFIALNQDYFKAYVEDVDFSKNATINKINSWISKSTHKMIPHMLDQLDPETIMCLINAIYFKGQWTDEFNPKHTTNAPFTTLSGAEITIDMMHKQDDVNYYQNDTYQVICLPYGKEETSMYVILPNDNTPINDVVSNFTIDSWTEIKKNLSEFSVNIALPKFKMTYGMKELNGALQILGIEEAFTNNADFSNISENLFIDKVLHKAIIEVNEKGSEAAAVTMITIKECAVEKSQPKNFVADRPFLFIIADDINGNILFIGKKVK